MLDRLYTRFDALADEFSVYKLETIGDGWYLPFFPLLWCASSHALQRAFNVLSSFVLTSLSTLCVWFVWILNRDFPVTNLHELLLLTTHIVTESQHIWLWQTCWTTWVTVMQLWWGALQSMPWRCVPLTNSSITSCLKTPADLMSYIYTMPASTILVLLCAIAWKSQSLTVLGVTTFILFGTS